MLRSEVLRLTRARCSLVSLVLVLELAAIMVVSGQ
jgi:hypothetical protein